jgi:hypothetical protein
VKKFRHEIRARDERGALPEQCSQEFGPRFVDEADVFQVKPQPKVSRLARGPDFLYPGRQEFALQLKGKFPSVLNSIDSQHVSAIATPMPKAFGTRLLSSTLGSVGTCAPPQQRIAGHEISWTTRVPRTFVGNHEISRRI